MSHVLFDHWTPEYGPVALVQIEDSCLRTRTNGYFLRPCCGDAGVREEWEKDLAALRGDALDVFALSDMFRKAEVKVADLPGSQGQMDAIFHQCDWRGNRFECTVFISKALFSVPPEKVAFTDAALNEKWQAIVAEAKRLEVEGSKRGIELPDEEKTEFVHGALAVSAEPNRIVIRKGGEKVKEWTMDEWSDNPYLVSEIVAEVGKALTR